MNTMLFINSDISKQAQAVKFKISRTTELYHSQTFCNKIYFKNLFEWEIEFLSSYFSEKCSNVRLENLVITRIIYLLILKYNRNHQYNMH